MTIAVSAVVKSSRLLFHFLVGLCLVVCVMGIIIGLGLLGELSPVQKTMILAISFLSAFLAIYKFGIGKKTLRIDISGIGNIHLSHYSVLEPLANKNDAAHKHIGQRVQLLEGSTLWANLMILRLKSDDQHIHIVPILSDSVTPEEFRSLTVALRWIANHAGTKPDR